MLPLQAQQVASRPLLHVVMKREQQKGVAVLSLRVVHQYIALHIHILFLDQHIFVVFKCAVLRSCFFLFQTFYLFLFICIVSVVVYRHLFG